MISRIITDFNRLFSSDRGFAESRLVNRQSDRAYLTLGIWPYRLMRGPNEAGIATKMGSPPLI